MDLLTYMILHMCTGVQYRYACVNDVLHTGIAYIYTIHVSITYVNITCMQYRYVLVNTASYHSTVVRTGPTK